MSSSATSSISTSVIVAAEPQILVSDLEAACAFYRDKLGFRLAFSYGEPAFYAQVTRDGARLNLRRVRGPIFNDTMRAENLDVLSATLKLDDAKPLYLELQTAGATFHQGLRTEPWGARTFIVKDLDGNLILFAGQAG